MSKVTIRATVLVMSVALLGLVGIQLYWIQNAYTLRQQRFDEAVIEALDNTAGRYDKLTTARKMALQTDVQGRRERLMSELDSINRNMNPDQGKVVINVREEFLEDSAGTWVLRTNDRSVATTHDLTGQLPWPIEMPGPDGRRSAYMDSVNRVRAESRVWLQRRAELVDEIFQEFVNVDLFRADEEVDAHAIDSILQHEMRQHGIGAQYSFAITDPFNTIVALGGDTAATDSLLTSRHRIDLGRGNMFSEPRFLAVHFPHGQSYVMSTMLGLLSLSGALVLIIIGSFFYTVNTIIRQKKLSDIKNDFINNMTHELKTPVSTISLACEALTDPDLRHVPGIMENYIKVIADENKRLGNVVENVLRTAIIDKGELKLNLETIDLHELILSVVHNMDLQVKSHQARVVTQLSADVPTITGDRVHLTNVVFNLVDNALKYTHQSPLITLSTQNKGAFLFLVIEDNGVGISKEDRQRIFERFYRVPTGNLHDVKGFGLGLSYVKAIVEKHRGTINVTSELGQGSRFEINLPTTETEQTHGNNTI